ncbi:MAG TPA: ABC transporter substrate-binding protein [Candidatus Megaira endosymbiont of Nemacystus decipiens]|nr:ABC transporter substrate-binding protein [Candidatus Megaera endosymbiont of Nemacystus decipiens]
MDKKKKTIYFLFVLLVFGGLFLFFNFANRNQNIPFVAIANYGPHPSLEKTIEGIKEQMSKIGYVEGKNIEYKVMDVNFEASLISQMITTLKSMHPDVIVTLSTPVAQTTKKIVKDIPIVFVNVTDPSSIGLIDEGQNCNITGASDKQNVDLMLKFAKQIIPKAQSVGLFYSTAEMNDTSLLEMLTKASSERQLELVAIPLEHSRDAATRIKLMKDKVDFLYTGSSAVVQTALPSIVKFAEQMNIPVINFNQDEVLSHDIFASYGVSHHKIGANAANIINQILNGKKPYEIEVVYPSEDDHIGYISKRRGHKINFELPSDLTGINIVN